MCSSDLKLRALKELTPALTVADVARLGLLGNALLGKQAGSGGCAFLVAVQNFVGDIIANPLTFEKFLALKRRARVHEEALQSLDDCEQAEMQADLFGNRNGYREKHQSFVYKTKGGPNTKIRWTFGSTWKWLRLPRNRMSRLLYLLIVNGEANHK